MEHKPIETMNECTVELDKMTSDINKTPRPKDAPICTPCKVVLEPLRIKQTENQHNVGFVSTPKVSLEFSRELKKVIHDRNILTSKTKKRVFEALDEIRTNTEEESRKFKREKALLEIVNSEIKYVHQLELVINYFMEPALKRKLLKSEEFETLFGGIRAIHSVNKVLLEELDKGPQNVPNAFSDIAPFLKLYSVYALDFKKSLKFLQNIRTLNPEFAKFVEDQETRPETQMKLSALLITPIQRVPRYKLLLKQLHELTSPNEKDYSLLCECLKKVEDAAEHINNVVEDQENMQRLLELQRCLRNSEPSIITPGRKLQKEGILMKLSDKSSHSEKLYVVLMSDIIMFNKMKKVELKVNSLKCISIFPLNKCRVFEILDKGCFRITCQEEEIVLYHEQLQETKKWISYLSEAIQNHLDNRKTLRKDSSSRRAVKRKDMLEYHVVGLSPGVPLKKRKIFQLQECANTSGSTENPNYGICRVSKRRNIHPIKICEPIVKPSRLFSPQTVAATSAVANLPSDVFVFGKSNNSSMSVRFGSLFGGIGNTVKKIFGFKN